MRIRNLAVLILFFLSGCSSSVRSENIAVLLARMAREGGEPVIRIEAIDTDAEIMAKKVILTGDAYHYGLQWGLLARESGIPMNRIDKSPEARFTNNQIIKMYRDIYPIQLEIVRGIAKAYQINERDIDMTYIERDFFINSGWQFFGIDRFQKGDFSFPEGDCGMAAVRLTENGQTNVIVGRNYDYAYNWPRFVTDKKSKGVYRSVGNTVLTFDQWVMDGINEKGLSLGIMKVDSPEPYAGIGYQPYPDQPSIEIHHLMRIILDTCASVQEAENLIQKVNVWFPDDFQHFIIADSAAAVIVEYGEDGKPVFIPMTEQNTLFMCGGYMNGAANTNAEYLAGAALLETNSVRSSDGLFDSVLSKLAVPEDQRADLKLATLWSSTFDLKKKQMDVRYIDNEYQTRYEFSLK
jgi:predicted choloylglycine hydrolase